MTKEPNAPDEQTTTEIVSKLLIDRPSDFRFHAAYLIYSSAWDKATSQEDKKRLNGMVEALSKDEIDYDRFYQEINRYRAEFNPEHFSGGFQPRIEPQRKRDWRKREEKDRRNARHGR
jgi:hypothetical protein